MSKHADTINLILDRLDEGTRLRALADRRNSELSIDLHHKRRELAEARQNIEATRKFIAEITTMGVTSERLLEQKLNLAIKHMGKKALAAFREEAGPVDVGMLERYLRERSTVSTAAEPQGAPLDDFREVDEADGYADRAAEDSRAAYLAGN